MPLYEYVCDACGSTFEQLRRMSEADQPAPCPQCASAQTERKMFSSFAAVGGDGAAAAGFGGGACAKPGCGAPRGFS